MTVTELAKVLGAEFSAGRDEEDREVTCGYTCDLLSWVMAHGEAGMAWTTVQTNMNIVAVAVLADMACVILPEGNQPEENAARKADEEGMPILTTALSAYEICGRMAEAGIPGVAR